MAGRGDSALKKLGMNFKSTMDVAFGKGKKAKTPSAAAMTMLEKVNSAFPGAQTSVDLADNVKAILSKNGYEDNKTLVATR